MEVGALLLAAGRGERMRPLTDAIPKPALPVLDVPLGCFSLKSLAQVSPPVMVNLSHLSEALMEAFAPFWTTRSVMRTMDEGPEPYGTGGTLRALLDEGLIGDRIVVGSADVVTSAPVEELVTAHRADGAPATALGVPVVDGADFELDGGRVVRYVDRRREPSAAGIRFANLSVLDRAAVELIPPRRPVGLSESVIGPLAESGELAVVVHDGYWINVSTAADFLKLSLDVLYGRAPQPPVDPPGEIVEVDGGRAYVGPGAEVPDRSALGPGAIVLAGARVEAATFIENAIVMPGRSAPSGRETTREVVL
jgi:mannose-1-phosphate guanylyltransferase